jgi:hypothetical protein
MRSIDPEEWPLRDPVLTVVVIARAARLTIDQEAYDISATVDDYFLTKADAPYCGQAQRVCGDSSNIVCPAAWTFLGLARWERSLANP